LGLFRKIGNLRALLGPGAPKMVFFAITNQCNAECMTCSFPKLPVAERKHVETASAKRALRRLRDMGVRMVSITGGEPLLHPDFLDICREIDRNDMMISYIATNGILLNEKIAVELKKLNVNIVGLSMDILDEKGFGRSRRYNVRKVVVRARKLLSENGINCYAGVLPGCSGKDLDIVIKQCEELGFDRVIFSYPQTSMDSSYRAAAKTPETDLTPRQVRDIVETLKRRKRQWRGLRVFNTDINLDEYLLISKGENSRFQCPGGLEQFYLDWNLNLFRCFNDKEMLGNALKIKNLPDHIEICQGCTQQAFRDYGSFYAAHHFLWGLKDAALCGNGAAFRTILRKRTNWLAIRSLLEGYLGGFV
jgi:MoaA/NifB/PqqE/SkfB family radical SAM enzyme